MFQRFKLMAFAASAATAVGSLMLGSTLAMSKARKAKTPCELREAIESLAKQGDKTEKIKRLDRRVQELLIKSSDEKLDMLRELLARAEPKSQRELREVEMARGRLAKMESDLDTSRRGVLRTGELCDAAAWAMRFQTAYAADALLTPGSYGEATRALSERAITDFQRFRSAAARSSAAKEGGAVDALLMELCGDAMAPAHKVGAWVDRELGGLGAEQAKMWALRARSCLDDRRRIVRNKAADAGGALLDAQREEMPQCYELAQIYWMGSMLNEAAEELRRGLDKSGSDAAQRQLGCGEEGSALAGSSVPGFRRWAARQLGLVQQLDSSSVPISPA